MTDTIKTEQLKRKARGETRVKLTGEIFTPMELCYKMVHQLGEEVLSNPESTYLDNSAGDGNFLAALYEVLTKEYGHDGTHVLNNQLYGVELMPDNVSTIRDRLNIQPGTPAWDHIVCADALTYDYSFSSPGSQSSITEEVGAR